jgi:hypothetical protein
MTFWQANTWIVYNIKVACSLDEKCLRIHSNGALLEVNSGIKAAEKLLIS